VVEAISITGVWWRQVPHGGDPWFRADPPTDGRWQRGEVVGAMYFADSEATAWAEWYRALAEFAIPPDRQMPRDLWRWEIEADAVVDASTEAALSELELPPPKPSRSDWPAFQPVGERLWSEGYAGVLAPSAARTLGRVLCLFRPEQQIPGAGPVRPAIMYRHAPAPPTGMTT
jgi:RES domain-containing protein